MTITDGIQLFFAVIGGLYTIASAISVAAPKTRAGVFCAKLALALSHVQKPSP